MRFDVNVSVRPDGSDELRTRTELKNMNSFNFAAKGIEQGDRPPGRDLRGRRHGRPGDAPLRSRQRELGADPLEGGGRGLPLLPRARPRAGASAGRARRAAARRGGGAAERADQADRRHALVLRRGRARHRGLDRLWAALVDAGADAKEAANVLANAFVATGIDSALVDPAELAKLVVGRSGSRGGVRRGAPALGRRRLQRRSVRRAESGHRRLGARPDHRRGSSPPTPARSTPTGPARRACSASSSAR